MKKLEEALTSLKECELERASRLYKGKTEEGCDGFHPPIPIVKFLEKVEQSGKWPQQPCTTMFFLIPKNGTSARPIALVPTSILWQQKYRVDWDSTHGRNGEAQQTSGKFCLRWRGSKTEQAKKIKEQWHWCWTWQRHLSGSVSQWCGLGRCTSASQERSCECCADTSST